MSKKKFARLPSVRHSMVPFVREKKGLLQLMSSVMLVLARQGDHSANVLYASCTTYDVRPI